MSKDRANARSLAATAVCEVLQNGRSLSFALPPLLVQAAVADRPLIQELVYGTLRWRFRLEALLQQLVARALKAKDQDITCLLLLGLYQLAHTAVPEHAAVHETVDAVRATGKAWAVPMVNAVLRGYQRRREALDAVADARLTARYSHPAWLIDALRADWPDDWEQILAANNTRPPFVLRVNTQRIAVPDYCQALMAAGLPYRTLEHADAALWLPDPVPVDRLPGFADGQVSVQDAAAQLAAPLLNAAPGMRVLDACAAPGGKAAHILETTPELAELIALDIDAARVERISDNLQRLGLRARTLVGDAARPDAWWDGRPFDRILLDAPCSATGVIRRHPDIKSLRRAGDVDELAATQARLLDALWPLLAPGGMLLYATCSVLRRENEQQIERFMQRCDDARGEEPPGTWGRPLGRGRQILPGVGATPADPAASMDGFYYAVLIKHREGG
jgi:16S rRNA (cytosine967-C5)-methyltransferase